MSAKSDITGTAYYSKK